MEIKCLGVEDCTRWEEFVRSHPQATIFHSLAWRRAVEKTFGHRSFYLYAGQGDEWHGVLPLFLIQSRLWGTFFSSVPFAVYGGICGKNREAEEALLKAAEELARRHNADYVEFRHRERHPLELPAKDLYVNFTLRLPVEYDEVWRAMPKRNRNILRKAEKAGLTLFRQPLPGELVPAELDAFYDLFSQTQRSLGTPVLPRSFFTNLAKEFGTDVLLFSAAKSGRIISSLWVFLWQDEVMPYYIGYDAHYVDCAPNNWILWELIKYACEEGYKYYDLGRSRRHTGSYDFKRHWGIEPQPLPYQYYLYRRKALPDLNPSNPLFSLPKRIWSRLPLSFTQLLGPKVVKYLG